MTWHKVEDGTLPDIGKPVLLSDGKQILIGSREEAAYMVKHTGKPWKWCAEGVDGYDYAWDFDYWRTDASVTHWAELPPLPEK